MAATNINRVVLTGNLTRDPELRSTPSGTSVSTFSIATSWRQKDQQTGEWKDHTDWHNIVFWRAENVAPYLVKGTQVYIEGRLQTRTWDDDQGQKHYRTEVVGNSVQLLDRREGGAQSGGGGDEWGSGAPARPRSAGGYSRGGDVEVDDLPFE